MPLIVELKPKEKIIIGESLIENSGDTRAKLSIKGDAPILREKDIITPDESMSPAKRVYFTVQLMYLDQDVEKHQQAYFEFVNDYKTAAPSALPIIDELSNQILSNNLYNALKVAKKLIDHEKERLKL